MLQESNPLITPKYKSYTRLVAICLNASLSAFFVGYSLVYIGSLTPNDFDSAIMKGYKFNDQPWGSQSVIQGAVPIGAILGALGSSLIIKFFSRRNGFLVTNIMAILSIILMVYIKNPYTFILMRLIQGCCTGIYSAIVPLYINQIVTPDLTNLGSLNQITIAFSQFFCFLLAFILNLIYQHADDKKSSAQITWLIISQFPLITITLQSIIFLTIFPYQTPKYLYEKGLKDQAAVLINLIYSSQHTQDAINRYQQSNSGVYSQQQPQIVIKSQLIGLDRNKTQITSNVAIFFAIHIALLQQMSGVNAIAVYGKKTLSEALQDNTVLVGISTLGLFIASVIASILTIKLMNLKGRKFLIQLGTLVCTLCLGAVTLAFFLRGDKSYAESKPQSVVIIIGMCIFMAFFGLTLGPIVWLYIPQIVQPYIIPFSTMTNLVGASICIIVFPLIKSNKFIPFLFFFVWCLASLVINQKFMVETRNKTRQTVFQEYRTKKLC